MNAPPDQREMKPVLAATLRLLIAFGIGLLLGTLGDTLAWNRLDNLWLYLCLLGPLLLGMSIALTGGRRHRDGCLSTLGASLLAWIGFYLTFIFIAFQMHPADQGVNPFQPDPDPYCSPCFSSEALFSGLLIVFFFPVGPFFVLLIAFATSSLLKFARLIRHKSESPK